MNKKFALSMTFALGLFLLGFSRTALAQEIPVRIPHKGHLILEGIDEPETVDPAWAYDTASAELINNVYEPLVRFDREKTGEFVPALAKAWVNVILPTPMTITLTDGMTHDDGTGEIREVTYTQKLSFDIRVDVPFHDGGTLTMEDVEYSFERWMVQDRSGGPTWMINEPAFGYGTYHVDPGDPLMDELIDHAFRVNPTGDYGATTFEIWLQAVYPPILGILAQSWGSIVNRDFIIAIGDWPGHWSVWTDYNDPAEAPVDVAGNVMCGTGPYMLDYWTHGVAWSIVRFPEYWGGWPYEHASDYLERVTNKVVYEWSTRLADFIGRSPSRADKVHIPPPYRRQVEDWPGIRTRRGFPSFLRKAEIVIDPDAMFFNFAIDPASPYVGSGTMDGNGIPLDFFSDVRIRKAFAYVFDYTKFIEEVWLDDAVQPSSPVIEGIPYHIEVTKYNLDLTQATELFQQASADPNSPAYGVWDTGFYFVLPYNTGNVPRQAAAYMLKTNVELVNPLFRIVTVSVTWSTFLRELHHYPTFRSVMPLFVTEWAVTYADPHAFVWPFMHTDGAFAYASSYSNDYVDELIEQGISTPDGPARAVIYAELQWLYYHECPSVMLDQPLGYDYERDWVQGWYYNPLAMTFYYHLWEGLTGDVNGDGKVDLLDAGLLNNYYWDPPFIGPAGYYDVKYDLNQDGLVNLVDRAVVNAHFFEVEA